MSVLSRSPRWSRLVAGFAFAGLSLLTLSFAQADPPATATQTPAGFTIYTMETAPESTHANMQWLVDNFGFVPNLAGVMAESPALLNAYLDTQRRLREESALGPMEVNIAQLAIAHANECRYCVSGHTMAGQMIYQTPEAILQAARAGERINDPRLSALQDFTLQVYAQQGNVSDEQLEAFYAAGFSRAEALDVVACVAAKVMSNYANAIADTPLDEPMLPFAEGLSFSE